MIISNEMRTAMKMLSLLGVGFYVTEEKILPCGCVAQAGWNTTTFEPNSGLSSCSDEHAGWFKIVMERWEFPDIVARYGDMAILDSIAAQMAEFRPA